MGSDFEKAIAFDALYKGLQKSCLGVTWKDSVASYKINGLKNTYKLRQDLLSGKYKISAYQRFMIHEPKEREIVATRIRDRQFQRSLCDNVLYPQLTLSFIRDNCACQRGRGVDDALDRMDAHLHRYFRKHGCEGWVLKCDIRHFFAETRHDVAKAAVAKRVKDVQVLQHVDAIIDSFGGECGIGLGSQVSQLVELAVLDDFDHWIKERLRVKHYIRYMDDFVLIHEDKDFLRRVLGLIAEKLSALGLTLNDKTCIYPLKQGVRFLKWRFVLTGSGKVIRRMNRRSIVKERRKLKKIADKIKAGRCDKRDLRDNYNSWKANAERGNTRSVVDKMERLYNQLMTEVEKNGTDRKTDGEARRRDGSTQQAAQYAARSAGCESRLCGDDDGCGSVDACGR